MDIIEQVVGKINSKIENQGTEELYLAPLIERVGKSISKIENQGIHNLSTEELCYVPSTYLRDHVHRTDLKLVWENLPHHHKQNEILKRKLPCYEHYNKGRTQLEGSPPSIAKCLGCIDAERMLEDFQKLANKFK